jgi:molybdopterin converting factor small subunit
MIVIELYGIPRLRAGVGHFRCEASTVGEAMASLADACPALVGTVLQAGRPLPEYRLSINGDRFVSDPAETLKPGDALLLISADAGG